MNKRSYEETDEIMSDFVQGYKDIVERGFEDRWCRVRQEIYEKHISETIGALMSRQATLSIEMAIAPTTWNGHVAPLFLRCMVDAYITFAWILADPIERSRKYIEYGLGQEKLFIEFLEEALEEEPHTYDSESTKEMIEARKRWLNGQLADWATEVNVGSWSGMSARDMAKEIGRESIYKHAYVPFSGAAHNMWQHVGIYNVEPCSNPLQKWHVLPKIRTASVHPDFMYRSAKYISMTYELFDEKMGIDCNIPLPIRYFVEHELFSADCADETGSG
ncbi:MAG: hypothetical protein F4X09_11900 [Gammaproteobacteria bacterium]|nr:hypothetical protein [Gammaproteobacteria bacterium]